MVNHLAKTSDSHTVGCFGCAFGAVFMLTGCASGDMITDVPRAARDVPSADRATVDTVENDVPSVMERDVATQVDSGVVMDVPNPPRDVPDNDVANPCAAGRLRCGPNCVDPLTDGSNCGSCGSTCGPNALCTGGMCRPNCPPGTVDCAGMCRNLQSDPLACGACATMCPVAAQSTAVCTAGRCSIRCNNGFGDCDLNSNNGCEVALTDINNCGACGNRCAVANGIAACNAGQCAVGSCAAGFADCDRAAGNGCEANTSSDASNCGACGNRCPAGQMCTSGVCRAASGCIGNPQWTPVTCTTPDWVWSMNRGAAMDAPTANRLHVLATGCNHGGPQPALGQGMCSLDGTGYVSTRTFTMAGCDASWWHIGGRFSGGCGGHDGDTYRLLALGANDCYAY